jgi:hypothetical protein
VAVGTAAACTITGPGGEICPGQTVSFNVSGLTAGTYHWVVSGNATITGPNNNSTVSVTAGASGSFTVSIVIDNADACVSGCSITRNISQTCIVNCPRTAGFWTQQCAQRGNGSTKYTRQQMDQILACVDQRVNFFNWSTDFDGFCPTVDPATPMTQRKQALRQFAVLVANVCADQLNMVMSNGGQIVLDLNTAVSFSGFNATTIGQLIVEIDAQLSALAGGSESASGYNKIIGAAGSINEGNGIGRTCGEDDFADNDDGDGDDDDGDNDDGDDGDNDDGDDDDGDDEDDDDEDDDDGDSNKLSSGDTAKNLNQAVPNPFRNTTRIYYAVDGEVAQAVRVEIYDISGRLVKTLAEGEMAPGRYEADWDGRNSNGDSVAGGVYFGRILTGAKSATTRILYVK